MRHLSFRIIFLCIFLPPVLYIFSIRGLEAMFQGRWGAGLREILVSDSTALLQGRLRIQDEIHRNVDTYFAGRTAIKWGVVPRVVVRTQTGRWLYPPLGQEVLPPTGSDAREAGGDGLPSPTDALRIARENMEIMEEGLTLALVVNIPLNTWLGNSLLSLYIFLFSLLLYRAYHVRAREAEELSRRRQAAIQSASTELREAQEKLRELVVRERAYDQEMERLQAQLAEAKEKVRTTEDEALAEIDSLEQKLKESAELRQRMEGEVLRLKDEVARIESTARVTAEKQEKQVARILKRFTTLYKNIEFHPRAIDGFLNLQGDQQLKAEEFIHNLNDDGSRVVVKRKVFAGKGTLPTFESEFAHRGRIYWNRTPAGKVQILAIGTKNTQAKDLTFLEGLEREA